MNSVNNTNSDTSVAAQPPTLQPTRGLTWSILAISIIALGITSYLGWVAMNSSKVAGCGGGSIFDCDDVINSRWSRWLGIPVSFLAFGMYSTLILAILIGSFGELNQTLRRIAWSVVIVAGLSAGLAAFWFTSLQFFVLKHLCTYCLAAHTCGLIIAGLLLWKRPLGFNSLKYLSIVSLLGFGVLIGGQLMFKPVTYEIIEHEMPVGEPEDVEMFEFSIPDDMTAPGTETPEVKESSRFMPRTDWLRQTATMFQPQLIMQSQLSWVGVQGGGTNTSAKPAVPSDRRLVSMSGGNLKLDVAQWPLAGKSDAKYIFVEMFDYTCDHCRRTNPAIVQAKAILDGDVAVLALPVPLNSRCNSAVTTTGPGMTESCEISQLAIAVWRVDPGKFEAFHNYLMSTPSVVTYAQGFAKANEMVDGEKLKAVLASEVPAKYIAQHVELYKRVGTGSVPKLLFPTTSIVGEFTSGQALADVIKSQIK